MGGGEWGYILSSADPAYKINFQWQSQIFLKFWKQDLMVNIFRFTEGIIILMSAVKVKDMADFRKYKTN